MARIQGSTGKALVLTAALLAAPGCAQWGDTAYGSRPYASRNLVVDGQVWSVDRRRGLIQLRSDGGRTSSVRVDNSTRVTYDRRSYAVDALERGDVVRVWVEVDRRGEAWADRVDVRQSARTARARSGYGSPGQYGGDRSGDQYRYDNASPAGYRAARLEGRVAEVNLRGRYFRVESETGREVEGDGSRMVSVHLPENLDRDELRKVEGLRRGDRVQVDVRTYSETDAELVSLR